MQNEEKTRYPRSFVPIGIIHTPFTDTTAMPIQLMGHGVKWVKGTTLVIEDVDILDGTPLLDLKPYVPAFDAYPDASPGWLERSVHKAGSFRLDERFR